MLRRLYRCLVSLHPPVFRERFEEELLWIFEEASGSWGAGSLVADASISLTRQWLIRLELWRWAAAGLAGLVPLLIAFGSFLPWDRAWPP
jgi:hypothetical protein